MYQLASVQRKNELLSTVSNVVFRDQPQSLLNFGLQKVTSIGDAFKLTRYPFLSRRGHT